MYLSVLLLPLLSSFLTGFFGVFLGNKGSTILSNVLIGLSFLASTFIFYEVNLCGIKSNIKLFQWLNVLGFDFYWGFLFDSVTATMLIVVTSISFFVHMYSTSYMEYDPHLTRFMCYLSLFTFFMLCLITSDNFVQMFLGWEGVGLASYLLINFWFTRIQANKAAIKAVIVNRFGDFGIILGLAVTFYIFKSLNFGVVFSLAGALSNYYFTFFFFEVHGLTLASIFFFIGAVGKSAQLGLHTWLPDAMEGPTPVSALIHAATMVTAGVFVLIRISTLLEYSLDILFLVIIFGGLTAFFAGTIGIFQNDLKRVIAYSTCSQLGYMVFACGLSNYSVSLFHLMNHAFFKALLFLSAGSVIHALLDEQDMRKMGGLIRLLPFTYIMFVIGSLALMGFPYTTGYYSKDLILELAFSSYYVEGIFSYWLGVLGACCTAFYSVRLLYLTFYTEANFYKKSLKTIEDVSLRMGIPLFILSLGSIFVGFLFKDMFVGVGTPVWGSSIGYYNSFDDLLILEAEFLPAYIKLFPVFLSILFGLLAFYIYHYYHHLLYLGNLDSRSNFMRKIYIFFNMKWFFDIVYNSYIVKSVLKFGYSVSFLIFDRGIIELWGPTGLVRLFAKTSKISASVQNGYIFNYIFSMMINLMLIIFLIQYNIFLPFDYKLFVLLILSLNVLYYTKTKKLIN